jgi:hypothetical protein
MDAFESIVAMILEEKGFWVKRSVKLNISKSEKSFIGKASMPRPEIDLVAFSSKEDKLILIEAKSFLDSYGVRFNNIVDLKSVGAERYKLLNDKKFQKVVIRQIRKDFLRAGLIKSSTKIRLGLAAGKICSRSKVSDQPAIEKYFRKKEWFLLSPQEIKERLLRLSKTGWENNVIHQVVKLVQCRD